MSDEFIVARNPEVSSLPFLVYLPIEGGVWLKARETWPRGSRVYCHPAENHIAERLEILERVPVLSCERRGPAIDLVLDRGINRRAQFIFTEARGRAMIFWQTGATATKAKPGLRIPFRPARGLDRIVVDTRERYGYAFNGRNVSIDRTSMRIGDYCAIVDGAIVAVVERKTLDDLVHALVDGKLAFSIAELAQLPHAAVVIEGTYADLLRYAHVKAGWLGELLTRLQVRYSTVPFVFVETRRLGEQWTFDFFNAAAAERESPIPLSALVTEAPPKTRKKRAP